MSESVARAQDAAGAQYAAVLFVGGVARAVVEVCWSAHHAEVWNEVRSWNYAGPDAREFDRAEPTLRARASRDETAATKMIEITAMLPDGRRLRIARERLDWPERVRPPEDVAVPAVDGWPALAWMTGALTVRSGPEVVPAGFPWRPPQPLRPRNVTEMVTEGARLRTTDGRVLTVRRIPADRIRLPSGRLAVADPAWFDARTPPVATAVPPGDYPVDVFQITENATARTAACRVTVTDAPVTSWHLALLDGDHELALGDGEFSGNRWTAPRSHWSTAAARRPAHGPRSRPPRTGTPRTAPLSPSRPGPT